MLKNFKLSKRDSHGSKGRISSSDISSPTQVSEGAAGGPTMKTVPVRYLSDSSNTTSPVSHHRHSPSKNRNSARRSSNKDLLSPEKVIKAKKSYRSSKATGISFSEGEFFYVMDENDQYFEASNPSTGKQGLVPKKYFEVFDKKRHSLTSRASAEISGSTMRPVSTRSSTDGDSHKLGSLYAIVLYDFKAEKPDELSSYAGENLFICAHHNFEWFIAKPIGRLGGPGLVPVGFVSIIDIKTGYATGNDVMEDISSVDLPTIQEWKGNVAKYKASNITLGQVEHEFEGNNTIPEEDAQNYSGYTPSQQTSHATKVHNEIVDASIDSFKFEDDKYWFSLECQLSSGNIRYLKRYYQDFYDLQVQLLDNFPSESGKLRDSTGQWTKRIVPYIPGPVPYVTDSITKKRKEDLNVYVKELIKLPPYICDFVAVRNLFSIRDNGYDREGPMNENIVESPTEKTTTIDTGNHIFHDAEGTHVSSPNNEDNTLTGDDLKLTDKVSKLSISSSSHSKSRPPSVAPPSIKSTKIKFYYKNDIFALMLNSNITYHELHTKIAPRIDTENFRLQVKLSEGDAEVIKSDEQVAQIIQAKLKISVHDLD